MAGTKKASSNKNKQSSKKKDLGGKMFIMGQGMLSAFSTKVQDNIGNRRIPLSLGLLLLGLSTLALIAVLSFLTTGGADQNIIIAEELGEEVQTQKYQNVLNVYGARFANFAFNEMFGFGSFLLIFFAGYLGYSLVWRQHERGLKRLQVFVLSGFAAIWLSTAAAGVQTLIKSDTFLLWGGEQGNWLTHVISANLGQLGYAIVMGLALLLFGVLISDKVLSAVQKPQLPTNLPKPKPMFMRLGAFASRFVPKKSSREGEDEEEVGEEIEPITAEIASTYEEETEVPLPTTGLDSHGNREEAPVQTPPLEQGEHRHGGLIVENAPEDDLVEVPTRSEHLAPGIQFEHYHRPSIDYLKDYEEGAKVQSIEEIEYNKQRIIDTLASFKMRVMPYKATIGPTVTLYEVIPEQGIKVSRIKSMEDDMAMSLKSEGVRIIAPMPGKGTVGIEVPNSTPQTVSMRTILASRKYNDLLSEMELPVGIGKTITNEPFVFDLAKMPHMLIAGATGQGKSVGLNAMITSLLYSKRPEELKFVLVDPKMLEFSIYAPLERHFMAKLPDAQEAIITDMSKVVPTLNSLCVEMDNRYRLLTQAKVRNIKEYNAQVKDNINVALHGGELMPYIVLIVDEFADLIMTSGKEVEQPIARLAQKARAAGIHMVIATQRPSTDVITGLIKANFPARIAFKVFSMIDSRTILDSPGANQLVGRGDMLFYQGKEMVRIQCAFLDTPETDAIVSHIIRQEGPSVAYELPEYVPEGEDAGGKTFDPRQKDVLFDEVARLVVNSQVGSTSNIQRKFNIGYNRAGRLMDQLEGAGIVSPPDGSKPREVYIKDINALEHLLEQLK